jgi:hypothetical protein
VSPSFTIQQLQQIHQILVKTALPLEVSLPLVQTAEAIMAFMQRPPEPLTGAQAPVEETAK